MDGSETIKWQIELKRGIIEMCILALLSRKEMYGYEISKALDKLGEGILSIEEGTLYPLLRRLERRGYIKGEWKIVGEKARKYYTITPRGLSVLVRMRSFWRKMVESVNLVLGEEI